MSRVVQPASHNLTDCDREPIHQLGSIQPTGCLVAVSTDWIVLHASANIGAWLGVEPQDILGLPFGGVIDREALHLIRGRLQVAQVSGAVERAFGVRLTADGPLCDVAVHLSDETIVIEAETSASSSTQDAGSVVRTMIGRVERTRNFDDFCREAARQMRALTRFDRVMVYRFASDESGEVIAEAAAHGIGSFLGLRYPASDIPQQARRLYERTWLRCIADVGAAPVPLVPQLDPTGKPLDLSLSLLRSVSPIHVEYLRNMGVASSLSVSILRNGKLWGLFACHHRKPLSLSFERRMTAELFGQMFSLLLEGRERERDSQYEEEARRAHGRILSLLADSDSPLDSMQTFVSEFRKLIHCEGFACTINDQLIMEGETPTREEVLGIVRFLNRAPPSRIYMTDEIGAVHEPGRDFTERACGLMAIPLSRTPRDYLVFFRREAIRTVTWAGDPSKPAAYGPNGPRLTPRKSFEAWTETVRGRSLPWNEVDVRIAESLRVTLLEVVLRLADVAVRTRKDAHERQELLIAELNHRVRNILSLVRALVRQSEGGATSVHQFASIVAGRIDALARAHDQITAENWGPAALRTLIEAEVAAYLSERSERVRLSGPEVLLSPQAFSVFALVVHELVTNSAKYGGLSDSRGGIDVTWSFDPSGRLVILWREHGGPPVQAPTRRGFGTTVIERSVPHDLQGEAEVTYALAGLQARFVLPGNHVTVAKAAPHTDSSASPVLAGAKSGFTIGGPVLLLEDNVIIALSTEDVLMALGATRVNTASNTRHAMDLLEEDPPVVAVLDINLGEETSFIVAERLRDCGTPFVFATGYGEASTLPDGFEDVPVLKKPYASDQVMRVLATALS